LSEDLYEAPREKLSQGDILEFLPSSHLVPPLRALFPREDGAFSAEADSHPSFDDKRGQPILATCRRAKALLLTYDCEIDKPSIKNWIICPVVPLSATPGAAHTDIKKNKVFHLLHLPKYRDVLEESVAVLNHVTTLERGFVEQARRIVSLSDLGRRALYAQHIRWLTRWQLRDIRCPNCAASFDAADGMIVRPDWTD
jgi:hypothetical protein